MKVFTNPQIKRLSNIFDNAGQVMFGSLVLTPLLDAKNANGFLGSVLLGTMVTLVLWWASLRFERISS